MRLAVNLVEAHEQVDERRLACARGSHHGNLLARLGGKRHVAHKRLVGRITKAHVLKGDATLNATRQLDGLVRQRIGLHLGLIEQVEHALRTRERGLKVVRNVADADERLHEEL